jgi:hypothetical protein
MSVARAYVPLSGSQMYVLPTRITANAQDLATSAAQTPAPGDQVHNDAATAPSLSPGVYASRSAIALLLDLECDPFPYTS